MLGRPWYRFSLRSLLVACAVCCAALAVGRWYYIHVYEPDSKLRELQLAGCSIVGAGRPDFLSPRSSTVQFVSLSPARLGKSSVRVNQILRDLPRLTEVDILLPAAPDPNADSKLKTAIEGLALEAIEVEGDLGLQSAAVLANTPRLKSLTLRSGATSAVTQIILQNHSLRMLRFADADDTQLLQLGNAKLIERLELVNPSTTMLSALNDLRRADLSIHLARARESDLRAIAALKLPLHLSLYSSDLSERGIGYFQQLQTNLMSISLIETRADDQAILTLRHVLRLQRISFASGVPPEENSVIALVKSGKAVRITELGGGLSKRFDAERIRSACSPASVFLDDFMFEVLPPAR